jgi:signal transduction histidine kinase/CheY-like chemotaxis protein
MIESLPLALVEGADFFAFTVTALGTGAGTAWVLRRRFGIDLFDAWIATAIGAIALITISSAIALATWDANRVASMLDKYARTWVDTLTERGLPTAKPDARISDPAWTELPLELRTWNQNNDAVETLRILQKSADGTVVVVADSDPEPLPTDSPLARPYPNDPTGGVALAFRSVPSFPLDAIRHGKDAHRVVRAWYPIHQVASDDVSAVLEVDFRDGPWVDGISGRRHAVFLVGTLSILLFLGFSAAIRESRARQSVQYDIQARDAFLASVSHEFRTPLNGILGLSDLLLESPLRTDQRDWVRTLRASTVSMADLVNDILDLSRLRAGRLRLAQAPFRVLELVEEVIAQERPAAERKGLEVRLLTQGWDDLVVLGDPLRLRQILVNLVNNAVKYTDEGSVRVVVTSARLSDGHVRVTIEVVDTGIGIPPEFARRVFEPFEQGARAITRGVQSSGLGLSVSRELATQMEGTLDFQSRPGHGTTFKLEVVLLIDKDGARVAAIDADDVPDITEETTIHGRGDDTHTATQQHPATVELLTSEPPTAPPRILVAEDNAVNQQVIRMMLERLGCVATLVENGALAVDTLRANPTGFDLVLLDLNMPVMSGPDAARRIRMMPDPVPPMVALTASVTPSDRQLCLDAGMSGFLTKPLQLSTLRDTLRGWLGERIRNTPQVPGAAELRLDPPPRTDSAGDVV